MAGAPQFPEVPPLPPGGWALHFSHVRPLIEAIKQTPCPEHEAQGAIYDLFFAIEDMDMRWRILARMIGIAHQSFN